MNLLFLKVKTHVVHGSATAESKPLQTGCKALLEIILQLPIMASSHKIDKKDFVNKIRKTTISVRLIDWLKNVTENVFLWRFNWNPSPFCHATSVGLSPQCSSSLVWIWGAVFKMVRIALAGSVSSCFTEIFCRFRKRMIRRTRRRKLPRRPKRKEVEERPRRRFVFCSFSKYFWAVSSARFDVF